MARRDGAVVIGRIRAVVGRAHFLYLALRDDRTPQRAAAVALLALAYVVFPGDFDFVPLLGWVDDAIVVTAGSHLVGRLVPGPVRADLERRSSQSVRRFALGAVLVFAAVTGLAVLTVWWLFVQG